MTSRIYLLKCQITRTCLDLFLDERRLHASPVCFPFKNSDPALQQSSYSYGWISGEVLQNGARYYLWWKLNA